MAARRFGLIAASGATYCASVYLALAYLNPGNDEVKSDNSKSSSVFSYVNNPLRTQTFQRIASAYDDDISKDEFVMGINLLRRSLLYFHAKGDVLEVGAGTGRNISYYPNSNTVQKIIMTDTSNRMLEQAQKKLSYMRKDSRFELKVADASNLSMYPDNSFDTVVDTFGLCSFDNPKQVLLELQRVCKPDGKILLLEHGTTKEYKGLAEYLDKYAERHAKNWGCVWNREIEKIVNDSGLTIETKSTWHFGTTYYLVCKPGCQTIRKQIENEIKEDGHDIIATACSCKHHK